MSEVAQSCPTLCNPMDCSPPGSSILGILQARVLEWVASAFSENGVIWAIKISTPWSQMKPAWTPVFQTSFWLSRSIHFQISYLNLALPNSSRCFLWRGFMCINLFISYELVKSWYNKIPWRKYIDFEKISLREMVQDNWDAKKEGQEGRTHTPSLSLLLGMDSQGTLAGFQLTEVVFSLMTPRACSNTPAYMWLQSSLCQEGTWPRWGQTSVSGAERTGELRPRQ